MPAERFLFPHACAPTTLRAAIGQEKVSALKGRLTFRGEIDRQHLLAEASVDDVRSAVCDVTGMVLTTVKSIPNTVLVDLTSHMTSMGLTLRDGLNYPIARYAHELTGAGWTDCIRRGFMM